MYNWFVAEEKDVEDVTFTGITLDTTVYKIVSFEGSEKWVTKELLSLMRNSGQIKTLH